MCSSDLGREHATGNGGQQVDQSQEGSNSNETSQSAESEAQSEQFNIYIPITVDSPWSNNGGVTQSNMAENNALSANYNATLQENEENQAASATFRAI